LVAPASRRLFSAAWSTQSIIALIAIVALETVFGAMARLRDLSLHIPEFMALALGAGVLYFIALYALEHTRDSRAVLWLVMFALRFA
jgi:predicted benzoate:H+ symporter BenE